MASPLDSDADPLQITAVPTEPILTSAEILKIYSARAFVAKLPNGKEIITHPAKRLEERIGEIVPGVRVTLEMTPYDFEKGRIAEINPAD